MKKKDITKIALMGLAAGCFLAGQMPERVHAGESKAVEEKFGRYLAAGSCGGSGGCGGQTNGSQKNNNKKNNGKMKRGNGNGNGNGNGYGNGNGNGNGKISYSGYGYGKSNGTMDKEEYDDEDNDEDGYYIPPERRNMMNGNRPNNTMPQQYSNPNQPMQPMSEKKLLSQCNDECRQRYQTLDGFGKQTALRIAAQTGDSNQAVREAQADMRDRMNNSGNGGRLRNQLQDKDWEQMREDVRKAAQEKMQQSRNNGLQQQ